MNISSKVKVFGYGEDKTNSILQNTYSQFHISSKKSKTEDKKSLIQKLKNAIKQTKKDKDYAYVSEVGKFMTDRYKHSAKNYGFNSWGDRFKENKDFQVDYLERNGRKDTMIVML